MIKNTCIALFCVIITLWSSKTNAQWDSKMTHEKTTLAFPEIMEDFMTYLSLPNTSDDLTGIRHNIDYLKEYLHGISIDSEIVHHNDVPYFFASYDVGAPHTVLFYLQLDGQPVDEKKWTQENPFQPIIKKRTNNHFTPIAPDKKYMPLKDHYVFARAASDSKGPTFAFLSALKILLTNGKKPTVNIKIIGDPQEEKGSPTISDFVVKNKELLAADALVIMDGTRHISDLPTLTFGARGIVTFQLILFGAERNLHSGQYGNIVENPVFAMARLLSDMKDKQGRVTIPGFYSGISFDTKEENYFKSLPDRWDSLKIRVGGGQMEKVGKTPQQALHFPSLNVRGLKAGWTENQVRTIIPNKVIAEFDMRLVPQITAEKQLELVKKYIQSKGYLLLNRPPTNKERIQHSKIIQMKQRIGSQPFRTSLENPLGEWLYRGSVQGLGKETIIKVSTTGGSQPIAAFINTLNIPAVSLRIPNPDNNIHAPNENLKLLNFKEGILQCLGVLNEPFFQ